MKKKVILLFKLMGVELYISAYTRKWKRELLLDLIKNRFGLI